MKYRFCLSGMHEMQSPELSATRCRLKMHQQSKLAKMERAKMNATVNVNAYALTYSFVARA